MCVSKGWYESFKRLFCVEQLDWKEYYSERAINVKYEILILFYLIYYNNCAKNIYMFLGP